MDLLIISRKTWKLTRYALHCCQNVEKLSPVNHELEGYPQTEEGFLHCFPPSSLQLINQIICIPSSIIDNNNKYSFFVKTFWSQRTFHSWSGLCQSLILKIYNLYYRTIALISHASKVMLKILQARLQQYVNCEPPDVQACFRKGRGTRDQIANIRWIMEKAREFQKNIYFCLIDYAKAFDCVDHNKLWKILK